MTISEETTTKTVHRSCTLCEAHCGLTIDVEDNRVVRVRGDEEDVLSAGYICPKGVAIGEPHRIGQIQQKRCARIGGHAEPAPMAGLERQGNRPDCFPSPASRTPHRHGPPHQNKK